MNEWITSIQPPGLMKMKKAIKPNLQQSSPRVSTAGVPLAGVAFERWTCVHVLHRRADRELPGQPSCQLHPAAAAGRCLREQAMPLAWQG